MTLAHKTLKLNNGMTVRGQVADPQAEHRVDQWGNWLERAYQERTAIMTGGVMEVTVPGGLGRADVVAKDCIYETKSFSYAPAAVAQLMRYSEGLPGLKLCVVIPWDDRSCAHVLENQKSRMNAPHIHLRLLHSTTLERVRVDACTLGEGCYHAPERRAERKAAWDALMAGQNARRAEYEAKRLQERSFAEQAKAWWASHPHPKPRVGRNGSPVYDTTQEALDSTYGRWL